ncbi:alpha/beta fold hydrolase [Sphingomonas sp.]|uniref:alpha/beta fold hydrolase n=1 Tax=Sphingomonas sp. TaxID=28214 RepID=UPI0035BC1B75
MPKVKANGVELFYDERGDTNAPAVLLVMGLGTQMIAWPEAFCDGLAEAGYRVIRYDNRDIGLSTTMDGAPAINPLVAVMMARLGLKFPLAYSLSDMAADAVGLMDALGIANTHVVGASMGGMIAQLVAAGWPDRVLTLTSVMSSSGRRGLPGPTPQLRKRLLMRRPAKPTREQAIAAGVDILSLISFPDPARGADAFREMAAAAFDRGYNPMGVRRQLLAILADGSRVERLKTIRAPTLVIHGAADPLVPLANSEDIAAVVPGAKLVIVPEMAHDLPPSKVAEMVTTIAGHMRQA